MKPELQKHRPWLITTAQSETSKQQFDFTVYLALFIEIIIIRQSNFSMSFLITEQFYMLKATMKTGGVKKQDYLIELFIFK